MTMLYTFQFTPTPNDYQRAATFFYRRRKAFWILIAVLAVLAVLEVFTLLVPNSPLRDISFLFLYGVVCFSMVVFIQFATPIQLRQRAARDKSLTAAMVWTVTEDDIEIAHMGGQFKVPWKTFGGFVDGPEYFLLLAAKNRGTFQILPKRAFATPEDQTAFRELLLKHLPEK